MTNILPKGILTKNEKDNLWSVHCIQIQEKETNEMTICLKNFICECLNISLQDFETNYIFYPIKLDFTTKWIVSLKNSIWNSFSLYLNNNVKLAVYVKNISLDDCNCIAIVLPTI